MPSLTTLLLLALCLYPALFVAVVIHEAGHALFAKLLGYRVTSLGLGTARPFFRTTFPGGAIFYLCRDNPTLGTCWTTTTELLPSRLHRALLLVGGGVTNLVIAVAGFFLVLGAISPGVFWLALAVMNALVGLINLLPFRHRVAGSRNMMASDGLQAVSLLLSRHARADVPQAELGFRELWEAVGDTRTLRYRLSRAALAALELKDAAEVTGYRCEAESLPGDDTDAHLAYLNGRIALRGGNRDKARQLLRVARHRYESHHAPGSVFLCSLYLLFVESDADVVAESLARSPLAKRSDIATKLAATRLLLFLDGVQGDGDVTTLETLLARYESARRRYRSDTESGAVYDAVAAWRERTGDTAGARIAREQAGDALRDVASTVSPVVRTP